ncbi:Aste57867_5843 [Aphanomyces stellatus]|uniref:Aste57867_5843 protein n=1 Tax=Aphanomyces stellatus TaxID=120398 RepID=A0A485KHL3_9STRA|nr:hypothetical protein As57867_005829 [Aphanomyces stellatus]VFT82866.1 Aste57867_5843 [Aphanomyces stellatus]
MLFCAECGNRYEDATSRFCAECGAPREMDPVVAPPAPAPVVPVPVTAAPPPVVTKSVSFKQPHVDPPPLYVPPPPTVTAASQPPIVPTTYGAAQPPFIATPAPVASTLFSATPEPTVAALSWSCPTCHTPYTDPAERFCGNCGLPRGAPPPTSAAADNDDDLFGAPPSSRSSFGATTAPPPSSMPPPPLSKGPSAHLDIPKPGSYPGAALVAAQLAGLTVKSAKTNAPVVDTHGSGAGILVDSVVMARDMDTLPLRQAISAAMDRNRTSPTQIHAPFHSTPVTGQVTVHQNMLAQSQEDAFYAARTLPDTTEWTNLLRHHRQAKTPFTDAAFPPTLASLYRDPSRPMTPAGTTPLESVVWKWKRISEFFSHHACVSFIYVELSIVDDDKKLVSGIAMKSQAEAESMIDTIKAQKTPLDARFLLRATDTVTAALHLKRGEHFLNLTKNLIESMSEYVDNGVTKFDLLWQKGLLDAYKPLVFAGVGTPYGYRLDGFGSGVSRVQVLVPIQFQAQQVCLFDREQRPAGECKPGRLADGYLFGALSMLSTSPTALSQLFPRLTADLVQPHAAWPAPHELEQQYNDEGVYCVRFWRNHKSYLVVVDDYIPCSTNGKPVFASFTGSISRFEIWSMLVEKAYAKLHGGYDAIVGGQDIFCLQDLFGGLPSSFPCVFNLCVVQCAFDVLSVDRVTDLGAGANEQAAVARLTQSLRRGNLIGLNNSNHTVAMPLGLKSGHTYGLVKLVQLTVHGQVQTLVQLRNTWADAVAPVDAAAMPWARGGSDWKQCSLDQKQRVGYQLADDGTVWMSLTTCLAFFTTIFESKNVYQFPSTVAGEIDAVPLYVHVVASEWKGLTCGGREAVHLNPQFQFTTGGATTMMPLESSRANAVETTGLLVHLEQPCRRTNMQLDYPCFVAPVVVGHATIGQRKLDIAKDVMATGTFISNRSCLVDVVGGAPPGTFAVIPATYAPFPSTFQLVVVSTLPLVIGFVSDQDIPVCCVCRNALKGTYRTYTSSDGTTADHVCQGACADQYRSMHAPVCVECRERIEVVAGRFSGKMFTLDDGTSCHAECMDNYRMRNAESCVHCQYAIVKIEGKFDGKYFALDDGAKKVHAECMEAYQLSIAKKCKHCGDAIVKGGRFDGRFYQLADSVDQVHFECWDSFQMSAAPKCRHCHEPIVKIEHKFDGRFFELNDGSGKVHFECWDAFRQH